MKKSYDKPVLAEYEELKDLTGQQLEPRDPSAEPF